MEVLVRKPPVFTLEPDPMYQRKVGESVEMHCDALEAEGTQKPNIQWQRRDGVALQKNRVRMIGGNITIETLRRSDFGFYQCVASNEVYFIKSLQNSKDLMNRLLYSGSDDHNRYSISNRRNPTAFAVQFDRNGDRIRRHSKLDGRIFGRSRL
jgi:immunoglobulin superfamily member 9B